MVNNAVRMAAVASAANAARAPRAIVRDNASMIVRHNVMENSADLIRAVVSAACVPRVQHVIRKVNAKSNANHRARMERIAVLMDAAESAGPAMEVSCATTMDIVSRHPIHVMTVAKMKFVKTTFAYRTLLVGSTPISAVASTG
jgi:hypothetical protein